MMVCFPVYYEKKTWVPIAPPKDTSSHNLSDVSWRMLGIGAAGAKCAGVLPYVQGPPIGVLWSSRGVCSHTCLA